jgi:hypothetical protein
LLSGGNFNIRVWDSNGHSYGQTSSTGQFPTAARGAGRWDNDYFLPRSTSYAGTTYQRNGPALTTLQTSSEIVADFCGYEPCPWATPNLSPSLYALVSGSLGALGSYPPIACRTVFKSLDWNTATPAGSKLWLRSASCPGYSWGQNVNDALAGETVTYTGTSTSDILYLDAKALSWMFPGLGITLGSDKYTVTGVYPYLGYVTVISAATAAGGPLSTNYSCASSCTIGQAAYSWTAY